MKKLILFAFSLIAYFTATAQQSQPTEPKLRAYPGFFSIKYELGDKDVTERQVSFQLEKTCPAAFYDWKRANALSTQTAVWSVIGGVGLLTTLFAKKTNTVIGAGIVTIVACGFEIGTIFGEKSKREKAITTYNRQFGY